MATSTSPSPDEQFLAVLSDICKGLLYPSESDEPVRPFVWQATEQDPVQQIARSGNDASVLQETTLAEFFGALSETPDSLRFTTLRQVLQANLSAIRVLRIGEVEVAIYVIGKTKFGNWGGVQTMSVET